MSPSLRHHLILQHAPDATRLPPLRSATHTHTMDTSQMLFDMDDAGDNGQGAGGGAGFKQCTAG